MQGYQVILKETRDVAEGTRLFVFEKPAEYVFTAGQYVAFAVPNTSGIEVDPRGLTRSLSIASAPCEPDLYFAMRQGESSFKQMCWQLKAGDTATITKAVGFFLLPSDSDMRPVVFLAGGIGITPVRSILKQAEHDGSKRSFTLLYSNRFAKDITFGEEINALDLERFRAITVLSKSTDACAPLNDERGYICQPMLEKYVEDILGHLYYIVGSPEFSDAMEQMLIGLGIPKEQRHMDPFTGLRTQAAK